jgi:hypothetical protein
MSCMSRYCGAGEERPLSAGQVTWSHLDGVHLWSLEHDPLSVTVRLRRSNPSSTVNVNSKARVEHWHNRVRVMML